MLEVRNHFKGNTNRAVQRHGATDFLLVKLCQWKGVHTQNENDTANVHKLKQHLHFQPHLPLATLLKQKQDPFQSISCLSINMNLKKHGSVA